MRSLKKFTIYKEGTMNIENLTDYFSNTYGNNTDYPELEIQYMDNLGLTRSVHSTHPISYFGKAAILTCPVKGIFDHYALYELAGEPHTFVSQPYIANAKLTEEKILLLRNWCLAHGFELTVDEMDSWYSPGKCYVLKFTRIGCQKSPYKTN